MDLPAIVFGRCDLPAAPSRPMDAPPFVPDHVTNAEFYDNFISDCGELSSTVY